MTQNNPYRLRLRDRKILKNLYDQLKELLKKAHHYSEEQADFEAYRYILQHTTLPPKEYIKVFYSIPEENRKIILKYLGYKDEKTFRTSFSKQLNVYRQGTLRREEGEYEI